MSKEQTPITAEEWSIEEHIKSLLVLRGFSKEYILNNRGLIGAIIEDMEQYAQAKVLEALERDLKDLSDCYKAHAEDNPKKEVCQVLHTLIIEKQEQIAQTKQK